LQRFYLGFLDVYLGEAPVVDVSCLAGYQPLSGWVIMVAMDDHLEVEGRRKIQSPNAMCAVLFARSERSGTDEKVNECHGGVLPEVMEL
jgi:hypothetical protein